MKIRFCAALLTAALSVGLLSGCVPSERSLDALEETVEERLDRVEQAVEDALTPAVPEASREVSPDPELITEEEAADIALADAGFNREQVTGLRTQFDRDDGRPEYEVDFRQGNYEYDYEIDAVTGDILSRDKDLED